MKIYYYFILRKNTVGELKMINLNSYLTHLKLEVILYIMIKKKREKFSLTPFLLF